MPQELRPEVIPIPYRKFFFIAEYKTRPNGFDLQLVLVSCGGLWEAPIGYGMFCIKFLQSRMQGERHRLSSVLSL